MSGRRSDGVEGSKGIISSPVYLKVCTAFIFVYWVSIFTLVKLGKAGYRFGKQVEVMRNDAGELVPYEPAAGAAEDASRV